MATLSLESADLAEVATSAEPLPARAAGMVDRLSGLVPFDGAWLALADPTTATYSSVASAGLDDRTLRYLSGPKMAQDIDTTGTNLAQPPLSPSDLPYPAEDLATWAECLMPAGFHEALAVALFTTDRRHVGFLAVLSGGRRPPRPTVRRRLHRLASVLATGVDPVRSLAVAARVLSGATAGAVLDRRSPPLPLPGLDGDPLLAPGSPLVDVARKRLGTGQVYASFLWPRGCPQAPEGHVRVTVLGSSVGAGSSVLGAVVLTPVHDVRCLTPRELEVLGLVVEGCSNQQIAQALVVTPRTVATHLEHILVKLDAPSRTLAAVRAEREGLYVPASVAT